jgi:hypothetical protein
MLLTPVLSYAAKLKNHRSFDEKNISTAQRAEKENARISFKDEEQNGAKSARAQESQGAVATDSQ